MVVAASGKDTYFDYSAYDGQGTLSIAMKIYDISSLPTPATLIATVAMTHVFNGSYSGKYNFPATGSKVYLVQISVYTDGTFTTLNSTYSPGSETVVVDAYDSNFAKAD